YDILGFNSRLDEIQAAILRVKLKYLDKWTEKRRANAALYSELLKDIAEVTPPKEINGKHVFNQYTIRAKRRDDLCSHLKSKGIGSMIYYPLSLHVQKAYEYLGYKQGDFAGSEKAEKEVLSLPIFPELTEVEIKEVVSAIRSFY
ncbi:MAG: DegT/DnrJ/EryC1/StrS family aminotransferase, partial [Candidatus Saganbacteria bacterium]|nr:DegT/DnrJ/EryC1/StrS family aminotransferase [Candidatus Saganbacteria bacterium]